MSLVPALPPLILYRYIAPFSGRGNRVSFRIKTTTAVHRLQELVGADWFNGMKNYATVQKLVVGEKKYVSSLK